MEELRGRPVGLVHKPLREAVHDEVRRFIVSGRFRQGERLFEDQLAQELDVSRNPVREALQALALEGFVELEPRRGARVATISAKRAEDLFEVRGSLEGLVARLAASRRTDGQLAELQAVVASGLDGVRGDRFDDLPDLNTRFHRLLTEAADNQLLADTLARLSHLVEWVYSQRIRQRSARSWTEHEAIVDAIAAHDEAGARQAAWVHIANARDGYFASPAASEADSAPA